MENTLVIFDIDGTLTDSKAVDDQCFVDTFSELFDINLNEINWEEFEDVTDTGLSREIIKKYKKREISKTILKKIQRLFFRKLRHAMDQDPDCCRAITGAQEFLNLLQEKQIPLCLATGGWRKSAEMKLKQADLPYEPFTLATSSDHYKRRTIINVAIARAQFEYQQKFSKFIYFGDGIWDVRVCETMGIPIIGVDFHQSGQLEKIPYVSAVIKDYEGTNRLLDLIKKA